MIDSYCNWACNSCKYMLILRSYIRSLRWRIGLFDLSLDFWFRDLRYIARKGRRRRRYVGSGHWSGRNVRMVDCYSFGYAGTPTVLLSSSLHDVSVNSEITKATRINVVFFFITIYCFLWSEIYLWMNNFIFKFLSLFTYDCCIVIILKLINIFEYKFS